MPDKFNIAIIENAGQDEPGTIIIVFHTYFLLTK